MKWMEFLLCFAASGSPKVLVIRVYVLSVHRRQGQWASSADCEPSWATGARPVWRITSGSHLHGAAHRGAARSRGDGRGIALQPAGVPPHVSQHSADWRRRQRRSANTRPVASCQQAGGHRLPVWLHPLPREFLSLCVLAWTVSANKCSCMYHIVQV